MPYIVEAHLSGTRTVLNEYYPEISPQLGARITGPYNLSEEERKNFPDTLLVSKPTRGGVPDILGMSTGPFWVSQRVRDVLEKLEPGVHEFIPLKLKSMDDVPIQGKTDHGTYYLIFHPPQLDCVVIEETDFMKGRGYAGYKKEYADIDSRSGMQCTLDSSVIAGHHFWRGVEPFEYVYFCSDEFQKWIKTEKIEGLRARRKCDVK